MGTNTRTRTAPAEKCATCSAMVTIGRWTERSKHTGRPFCDSCGHTPRSFEVRYSPPAPGLTERLAAGSAKSYVDQVLARRARQTPEERAEREWLEERIAGGLHTLEDRYEYDDDEYEDYGTAEVRSIDDDFTWVYGPEPDGVPRAGRAYESRWWVEDDTETRARETFIAPAAWELR